MKVYLSPLATVILACAVTQISAQSKIRVKFPAGTHGTTVQGTVRGYAYRDYLVRANAGQTIDLKLTSTGNPSVFVVFLSDMTNLAGATEMEDFTGELPAMGDYIIRVLMMRSEARRKNSNSNYKLKISIK